MFLKQSGILPGKEQSSGETKAQQPMPPNNQGLAELGLVEYRVKRPILRGWLNWSYNVQLIATENPQNNVRLNQEYLDFACFASGVRVGTVCSEKFQSENGELVRGFALRNAEGVLLARCYCGLNRTTQRECILLEFDNERYYDSTQAFRVELVDQLGYTAAKCIDGKCVTARKEIPLYALILLLLKHRL